MFSIFNDTLGTWQSHKGFSSEASSHVKDSK